MADRVPKLDDVALRELEATRKEHIAALRDIPLEDKEMFAAACARYEERLHAILQAAAHRSDGDGDGEAPG
jgi:hypothetical protein